MPHRPGDYKVVCEICGFERLRSECRKNWNGQIVCADTCYNSRHPQENVKTSIVDTIFVKDPRPRPADKFMDPRDITADDL